MKKRIKHRKYLFLLTMFFFVCCPAIKAQPGCRITIFNPFDNYAYDDADLVVYGSGVDYEALNKWANFQGGNSLVNQSRAKIKVQVKEELKGNIDEKEIEVYVGYDCHFYQVGGKRIFTLKKTYIGDKSVWVTDRLSSSLDKYSKKGLKEVLTKVKRDLKANNKSNLYGVIVEKINDELSHTVSDEIQKKLGYHPKNFNPMTQVTVEAKRKADGEIFRTITDSNGKFKFRGLADGEYRVYPLLSDFYRIVGFYSFLKEEHGEVSTNVFMRDNWANPRTILKLETFGNLKGNIENVFPEFGRYSLQIWKIIEENGKKQHQSLSFFSLYGNSESFEKSESSINLNIQYIPTGKYIIELIGLKRNVYYPGTTNKEEAQVFEVKKGKTTDVSFRIPD